MPSCGRGRRPEFFPVASNGEGEPRRLRTSPAPLWFEKKLAWSAARRSPLPFNRVEKEVIDLRPGGAVGPAFRHTCPDRKLLASRDAGATAQMFEQPVKFAEAAVWLGPCSLQRRPTRHGPLAARCGEPSGEPLLAQAYGWEYADRRRKQAGEPGARWAMAGPHRRGLEDFR